MIIEELTKLDKPKRKVVDISTVLVIACICYFAITRDSVTKLKAVHASYSSVQTAYAATENQQGDFHNLQKQLDEEKKQFCEYQRQYFSSAKAARFFENINSMALAYNLKPVSQTISEQIEIDNKKADKKAGGEESKPKPLFLKTQSARVVVSGNYFDIIDFVNHLTERQEKVCITNLNISLSRGDSFEPKASFKITLAIDLSKDIKK